MGKPDYSNKYLSTSSLARLLEVSGPELFLIFENKGYLLKEEGQWRLTQLGLELGGKYGSVGGPAKFPIWPITIKNLSLFKEIKEKKHENNIHTESKKSGNINKPLYQYINDSPRKILKKVFGYDDFKENQIDIIKTILNGKNAFVLMPTGSGKSLCYQIPSIIRNGVGIVISPLIALMEDQVKGLQQNGLSAAYLNSTLPFKKAKIIQEKAADGRIDILYVAPEKLLTPDFQHFLANIKISLFAIDEVHCVSQWGHDFRPEYRRINEVTKKYPETPRIALTATADAITQKDILDKLGLKNAELFVSSFDRPNIRYHVLAKRGEKGQLFDYLQKNRNKGSGIVYVRTRKRSENIARWLTQQGIVSLPYHAGLPSEIRFENQNRFQENDIRIIVATIAFGMGIDKPDVRFVIHLDLPASMEAYYQETGRAGRDGQQADAWMLYSLSDVVAMRRIFELSEGSNEYKHVKRKKLDALLGYCESVECRKKLLLNYFGENYDGPCQACDNCLNPAETWYGTLAAQKALSCVYRTGQRFGALHLANVLMGKHTKQILHWNHDRLKTFGIGKELDEKTWMSVFRQLLSAAFLSVESGQFSGIRLTKKSWTILRGKQKVFFRNDLTYSKAKNDKQPSTSIEGVLNNENKQDLFETLRKLRLKISKQLKVPPYIIFNDQSLKEMALFKPATVNDFLQIKG